MGNILLKHRFFWLFLLLITIIYLGGEESVPFHPDEATQIWMSDDLKALFTQPGQIIWSPANQADAREQYRLLDAPLTRYLIGAGRLIAGNVPAQPIDWNWSLSWQANQQRGALPDARLLLIGRLSVALLFPFSLAFMYFAAKNIGGTFAGWTSAILFCTNALILMHTRRAMAESGLIFGVTFFLWSLSKLETAPWLPALAAAIAFNAKQSNAPLMLVALSAIVWLYISKRLSIQQTLRNLCLQILLFGVITLALNPFLWGRPIEAVQAAWSARLRLTQGTVRDLSGSNPDMVWTTVPQRLIGLTAHVFFSPPASADAVNYVNNTRSAENRYFSNPLNDLLRGFTGGGILLVVFLAGLVLACMRALRSDPQARRLILLLLITTISQIVFWLLTTPLPYQRYSMPVLPSVILWSGFAIAELFRPVLNRLEQSGRLPRKLTTTK